MSEVDYIFKESSLETNKREVIDYVRLVATQSISALTSPCTRLSFRPHFIRLLQFCDVSQSKVRDFPKVFWNDMPESKRQTWMNPVRMFECALLSYFSNSDKDFKLMMTYTLLDIYSSVFKKFFKYCKPDLFEFSLTLLSKNHLFSREGSISASIMYLSDELSRKYMKSFKDVDKSMISKFISESRTRIAQSLKSLAKAYYQSSTKFSTSGEQDQEDKYRKGGDLVAYQVATIGRINNDSLRLTKSMVDSLSTLALQVVKEISDQVYIDDISNVVTLFLKSNSNMETKTFCDNKKFLDLYKKMLKVKESNSIFKFSLTKLVDKASSNISQTPDYQTSFVVGLYLINVLRVSLCKF